MKNNLLQIIKFFIGWPLTIIAFFFIAKFMLPNLSNIFIALQNISIFPLFLGILCITIYFFLRSFFWQQLLRHTGHHLSYKETAWLWGSAELKRYIPGNIWSFIGRTKNFSQKNISKTLLLSSTIRESECIVMSCLCLSLLAINFIVYGLLPNFWGKPFLIIGIVLLSIFFIFCFLANQYLLHFFQEKSWTQGKIWQGIIRLLPAFSFKINCKLFCIQLLSLFFFGLGTYFSITSFVLLYPLYITTFIGFFVFSLLVGYISFITPMGLGVREAVMTTGLIKFIAVPLAGFSALFSRFVFILGELCFLLLSFYWYKTKNPLIFSIEKQIKKHWQPIVVGIITILYILYMTTATFLRYDNFYTGRFDLGNMDQTVWNTLHGRIFQLTDPNGTRIVSRLAFHADFILILLAPFYLLWQDPKMLLLLQTIILAFGSIFIYLIAKQILKNKNFALVFSFVYLINPSMNYTNLYDFHGVTLATTFLLGAFYFLQKKKWIWYMLFLILAGLTKEEVWSIVAFFGLYTIFLTKQQPNKRTRLWQIILGISITTISLAICSFLFLYAIPHAKGGTHFALAYYADFGSSPIEIAKNIFFKPQKTLMTIFQKAQLLYLLQIFSPSGFIAFVSPTFLLFTVPDLVIDLLSSNLGLHQIYYQYTASITPFVCIATIYGVKKLQQKYPTLAKKYIASYLLVMALLTAYLYGPLPGSKHPNLDMFDSPQPYANLITNFLQNIPKRYSIAATNTVGSHLSHRQKIFTIPVGIDVADIIIFLLNDTTTQPSLVAQKKIVEEMKQDKKYIEVFKQGNFVVFEKRNLYKPQKRHSNNTPFVPLAISALEQRDYVGGEIKIEKKITTLPFATRYLISYLSDGLTLYALMEVPNQHMPITGYPVVIVNHDSIVGDTYDTIQSETPIVDAFAQKGFLVIKPDYRGNANSETDPTTLAPLPYSIDVLHLMTSLKTIPTADSTRIFLWGQGLGGEVVLKTTEIVGKNEDKTLQQSLKGAVVWSPVTTPDQWKNETMDMAIRKKNGSKQANPTFWQNISAKNYLDDIHTPIEIDQGTGDTSIAYSSSIELYDDLVSFNKNATLRLFPEDDHELATYQNQVLQGNSEFFKKLLAH